MCSQRQNLTAKAKTITLVVEAKAKAIGPEANTKGKLGL